MRAIFVLLTLLTLAGNGCVYGRAPMPKRPLYHTCIPYGSMKCALEERMRPL